MNKWGIKIITLTKDKEKKLKYYINENFPEINFKYQIDDKKIYIISNKLIHQLKIGEKHIDDLEVLLNGKFKGIISTKGYYAFVYLLNSE